MQYCSHYSISVISESSSWSVSSAVEIQWCKLHILYQYKGKCLFLCHENKVYSIIWPLTLKDDLDLEPPLLKILVCMRFTCMLNIKYLSSIVQKLWLIFNYLTFDLKGWPWPWPVTPQNVLLYEMHVHDKYQCSIWNSLKMMSNVKVMTSVNVCHLDEWHWP